MAGDRKRSSRAKLVAVTFKADPDTVAAIDELAESAACRDGVLDGGRSFVIRRAIKNERARVVRR